MLELYALSHVKEIVKSYSFVYLLWKNRAQQLTCDMISQIHGLYLHTKAKMLYTCIQILNKIVVFNHFKNYTRRSH